SLSPKNATIDEHAAACAAENGHLHVLGFLIQQFYTVQVLVREQAGDLQRTNIQESDAERPLRHRPAVELSKMQFVEYLYAFDPSASYSNKALLTSCAAEGGHLDMIKFSHECGDPEFFDMKTMYSAVVHGHLDIVKFLHENREEGCTRYSLEYAHMNGHHDVVGFLCEHRLALNAKFLVGVTRGREFPDLAEKIERGAAAATQDTRHNMVRVAVVGCAHGLLDDIYATVRFVNELEPERPVELLLCCGDFECMRNARDLATLACPPKYRAMHAFHAYYSGARVAPVLTLFVGGNHEASGYLSELHYGGWVAPNMFYLGAAGAVSVAGLRVAGLSGIYKAQDYTAGRFERLPLDNSSMRSIYHVRELEVFQLAHLQPQQPQQQEDEEEEKDGAQTERRPRSRSHHRRRRLDVFLSHDWPRGVEQHGDVRALVRRKPFFQQEIAANALGSPAGELLLHQLKPRHWFAAHLHVKFAAIVRHGVAEPETESESESESEASSVQHEQQREQEHQKQDETKSDDVGRDGAAAVASGASEQNAAAAAAPAAPIITAAKHTKQPAEQVTKFLALDKCLPRREFLQVLDIPTPEDDASRSASEVSGAPRAPRAPPKVLFDYEWLAVLRATHHLASTSRYAPRVPQEELRIEESDVEWVRARHREFVREKGLAKADGEWVTDFVKTAPAHGEDEDDRGRGSHNSAYSGNPQTDLLLEMLKLPHVVTSPYVGSGGGDDSGTVSVAVEDPNEIDLDDEEDDDDDDALEEDASMEDDANSLEDTVVKTAEASGEASTAAHGYHIHRDVAGGAASSGNLDVLLFLRSVGPENATTDESAVSCAAENGHLHVIELLIQQSEEDIGKWMDVAYTSAIQVGQLHVVRYMHENGYECRHGDICKAAENGHVDVVRYMLENRVGIDANDALDRAARRGHLEVVKLLCANGWVLSNYRVFEDVIKNDSFDILQILCQSGIDRGVRYAMVAAMKLGKIEFVKFLYELDPVGCADGDEGHLVMIAAERGYLDIIKFWYECGDPRFSLSQAMHCASMSGHLDIVKFLHENGYGGCKKYSLEHAYEQGHHDVVDFLCEHLPALNADELVRFLGRNTFPDLAEKIERGAAAAVSGGRNDGAHGGRGLRARSGRSLRNRAFHERAGAGSPRGAVALLRRLRVHAQHARPVVRLTCQVPRHACVLYDLKWRACGARGPHRRRAIHVREPHRPLHRERTDRSGEERSSRCRPVPVCEWPHSHSQQRVRRCDQGPPSRHPPGSVREQNRRHREESTVSCCKALQDRVRQVPVRARPERLRSRRPRAGSACSGKRLLGYPPVLPRERQPPLLRHGAMHCAAVSGHLEIVKFLHENRKEGCNTFTLEYAHKKGHHHVVDYLCEHQPMMHPKHKAEYERQNNRPDLAAKIEQAMKSWVRSAAQRARQPGLGLPALEYAVDVAKLSPALQRAFVELDCDEETQTFLESCTGGGVLESVASTVLGAFYSLTDVNGMLGPAAAPRAAARRLAARHRRGGRQRDRVARGARGPRNGDRGLGADGQEPQPARLQLRPDRGPRARVCAGPAAVHRHQGLFLLAVVLPFSAFVEVGTQRLPPTERLSMRGGLCHEGATFEAAASVLLQNVLQPAGFKLVQFSRVPYLCRGDLRQPYYVLSDAVFVLQVDSDASVSD
ncbi:hypothetical protein PybrP1_011386, partial [[Pythium] brassicae (nom. inval.)]